MLRWSDGRIMNGSEPAVSPGRRSFGAFTTVGCDGGGPLLWDRHAARLRATLEHLVPGGRPVLPAPEDLRELLDGAGLRGPARARVVCLASGADEAWTVEAAVEACAGEGAAAAPVRLRTMSWPSAPPLAGHKTLSRLAWDLARRRARDSGADDALIVDRDGRVLETAVANVFARFGAVLVTPPAPERCLPGLLRGWLVERIGAAGLAVREDELLLDEVMEADEVWISNCVVGVVRVAGVDGRDWRRWEAFPRLSGLRLPAPGWR